MIVIPRFYVEPVQYPAYVTYEGTLFAGALPVGYGTVRMHPIAPRLHQLGESSLEVHHARTGA